MKYIIRTIAKSNEKEITLALDKTLHFEHEIEIAWISKYYKDSPIRITIRQDFYTEEDKDKDIWVRKVKKD